MADSKGVACLAFQIWGFKGTFIPSAYPIGGALSYILRNIIRGTQSVPIYELAVFRY
jgi:hypothetical protein